jgi:hypothetical protein
MRVFQQIYFFVEWPDITHTKNNIVLIKPKWILHTKNTQYQLFVQVPVTFQPRTNTAHT